MIKTKKAGRNLMVVTDKGAHYCFDRKGSSYELNVNKFFYKIPLNYTEADILKALKYCDCEF